MDLVKIQKGVNLLYQTVSMTLLLLTLRLTDLTCHSVASEAERLPLLPCGVLKFGWGEHLLSMELWAAAKKKL